MSPESEAKVRSLGGLVIGILVMGISLAVIVVGLAIIPIAGVWWWITGNLPQPESGHES